MAKPRWSGESADGEGGEGGTHVRVAVIGAGFTGLAAVHALREANICDFVVLERAQEVGGAWRDNTYPGLTCDIPSHLYSLSFAPNPNWQRTNASGPEIREYTQAVARTLRMQDVTHFGEEVLNASWDEAQQHWRIRTTTLELTADAIIDGSGPLSEPTLPAIHGLDRFGGKIIHSARWDHEHPLHGQRVAVIGTGASAVGIVPAIQPDVAALTVFQRTPGWVLPRIDRASTGTERRLLGAVPALRVIPRGQQYLLRDVLMHQLMYRRWMRRVFQVLARAYLRRTVQDPELRAKLQPAYEIGCKRILTSNRWYQALRASNVTVETSPIREVREHAVITADGVEHVVDAIVLATGFHATDPPIAHRLHGRDGSSLAQTWGDSPRAYKGVTTANFPNLFRIGSIGTFTGHISHLVQIESGVRYAVEALRTMTARGLGSVEISQRSQEQYARRVRGEFGRTVWVLGGCASWYLDKAGQPSSNWPSTARRYRNWTRHFDVENYDVTPATAVPTNDRDQATTATPVATTIPAAL